MNYKLLLPFNKRFTLLHLMLHSLASTKEITSEECVQMMSVLCPICPSRITCTSDIKFLEELTTSEYSTVNSLRGQSDN